MAAPRVVRRQQQPTYGRLPNRLPATNFGTYTQRGLTRHPNAPAAPSAPSPFTPVASGASGIGSSGPAASAPDPRDAQYFNDIGKVEQYYTSQKANITASQNAADRALAQSKTLLDEQQPKDTLSAKQNANKAGLFYSGALGKNLGDIETSYTRRRTELQGAYDTDTASRQRQSADLEANYGPTGLMRNDPLLSAVGRQSERDQTQGVPDAPVAAAPAAPAFKAIPGRSSSGAFGVWHVYPDGRKVFVKK